MTHWKRHSPPRTLDEAIDRIEELEAALGQANLHPTKARFTKNEAVIAALLATRGRATIEAIMAALYVSRGVDERPSVCAIQCIISRMRKKLNTQRIAIVNEYGEAYRCCSGADQARLKALFEES